MEYWANINSQEKLVNIGLGLITADEYGSTDVQNIEVAEEVYNNAKTYGTNYYKYDNGEIVLNPNYEQEQAQKERERIGQLCLTRGDVFRGLLQAKGITRTQLRGMIDLMPEETQEQRVQKELAYIDFDEALNFYRGVPLVDTLSSALGITSEQMTKFFETGDWHELIKEAE